MVQVAQIGGRGGGGRGNSGNAQKKTFIFSGGLPLVRGKLSDLSPHHEEKRSKTKDTKSFPRLPLAFDAEVGL